MRFFVFWKLDPRGPKGTQNNVFESILSPGPNVGPRDPKPKRCGPKNHAKPRLQNSKWCHMVQVVAKNHFGPGGPSPNKSWIVEDSEGTLARGRVNRSILFNCT